MLIHFCSTKSISFNPKSRIIFILRMPFVLVFIVMNTGSRIGPGTVILELFFANSERWNYSSLNHGLGGSEEAVLYLAEALAIQYPR